MTYLVKKGSFQLPTSDTSGQTVTTGFQPIGVLLFATKNTSTGYITDRTTLVGFSDGTNTRCITAVGYDNQTVANNLSGRGLKTNLSHPYINYAAGAVTDDVLSTVASFTSTGFTVDTSAAAVGKDYIVHYLAWGGSDITNAYVGTILSPATTPASVDHTGFGFQPDFMLISTLGTAAPTEKFTGGRFALGATDGTNQVSVIVLDENTIPTQVGYRQLSTRLVDWTDSLGAQLILGEFTSFISDGVRINWTTVPSTQRQVFVLALKGGQYWVGTDTQKTSTGTQSKTGVGFTPSGLLTFGANQVNSGSFSLTSGKFSMGASDGTSEGAIWGEATDNVSTSDVNSASITDKILRHASNPSTTDAEADLSSFDADGYTLNWSAADATAREFLAMAFGANPAAGPETSFIIPMRVL